MQDVLKHPDIKLYRSGLDYLTGKFPDFGKYKRDIQDAIISRVNRGAIKGDFAGTPAIFRMKQLGEEDRTFVDNRVDLYSSAPKSLDDWYNKNRSNNENDE
jgi:hypothetical protein